MLVYFALDICFPDQKQKELTLFCEIEKTKNKKHASNE